MAAALLIGCSLWPGCSIRAQPATPTAACQVEDTESLPIQPYHDGRFLVTVMINDKPEALLVDTGAERTTLNTQVADALALPQDSGSPIFLSGVGGVVGSTYLRVVKEFGLGTLTLHNFEVAAGHMRPPGAGGRAPMPAGVLGTDVLSQYDVELDFSGWLMRLHRVSGCNGSFVPPWHGRFQTFHLLPAHDHSAVIEVGLNGRPLRARIDTGAPRILVGLNAALASGVNAALLNEGPVHKTFGAGGLSAPVRRYRFETLTIGKATLRDVPLTVVNGDLFGADMLLGMGIWRNDKLWISYSTRQVFTHLDLPDRRRSVLPYVPAPSASDARLKKTQGMR